MGQEAVTKLNVIKMNNHGDVTQSCTDMFGLWRQRQPSANWDQLIAALKTVKLDTLANKLENLLIPLDEPENVEESEEGTYS